MTTCLRASLLLVASTVKVALLAALGLALGLLVAPVVVAHTGTPAAWTARLERDLGPGPTAADAASWTDPSYLRARWTALSGLLDG